VTPHPLSARCVLLDIEGTVSDIRFVYDVMFPYAKENMLPFLHQNWGHASTKQAVVAVANDAMFDDPKNWLGEEWESNPESSIAILSIHLQKLMDSDSKATGLKQLQGLVWQTGFETGKIKAELFDDVLPALQRWQRAKLDIRIYSSGSVLAQKMFFSHTTLGNLASYFSAHYDTLIGPKKECDSYKRIAADSQIDSNEIVFITDVYAELIAAQQAGMQTVASIRQNNVPLPAEFTGLAVNSFDALDITPLR
jgi:enolase-phosphatase E1